MKSLLLILLSSNCFNGTSSMIIIDKWMIKANEKIFNQNFTVFNDNIHDSVMNVTFELLAVVERCTVKVKLRIPESNSDQQYRREVVSTSVDAEKAYKGIYGSFVTRVFMENYLKSADFELKFPFKKRVYRLTNFVVSDNLVPFSIKSKVMLELIFLGKVQGLKGFPLLGSYQFYAQINKS